MPKRVLIHVDLDALEVSVKVYDAVQGKLERELKCRNVKLLSLKGAQNVLMPSTLTRRHRVLVCEYEEPIVECAPPRLVLRERDRGVVKD